MTSDRPETGSGEPTGPLDRRVLAEIHTVGGDGLVRELLEIFVERTPARLQAALEALGREDLAGAAKALHSLRSAAGTVGARELAHLAGRLERAARGGGEALEIDPLRRMTEEALAASRRLRDADPLGL